MSNAASENHESLVQYTASGKVMLACRDLTRIYREGPQDVTVLDGLALEVRAGERVAIVGSSGSGKTTLLNLLGGLDRPTSGEVIIAGESLLDLGEAALGDFATGISVLSISSTICWPSSRRWRTRRCR